MRKEKSKYIRIVMERMLKDVEKKSWFDAIKSNIRMAVLCVDDVRGCVK